MPYHGFGVQARMAEMQSRWEERFCEAVDFWHQAWSTTTSVAPAAWDAWESDGIWMDLGGWI